MPFNKDGKRKPMSFNAKRVEAVKAGKDSFEVGGKSFPVTSKAMKYKPMKHKGPYMMKPGSREKDTPGSFREEVAPMYYGKKPMMFKASKNPMMTDSDKVLSEMSINRSLAGKAASGTKKRTMAGRSLKSAGKVNVESSKPGVKIVEKAKPVSIPKPVKKQGKSSFEDRARKAVGAPSKRAARKMKLR
tara:strand:- start:78 stop:641 length:564 start_codon:yes stop_codon:yes gene_type:complete